MAYSFRGGIHPGTHADPGYKSATNTKPIEKLALPDEVILPVSMHIGAPAKPIVSVGDTVDLGQPIAEAGGFVSAPVHATVSGKVKAIEPRLHPNGSKVLSIVIENDGEDRKHESVHPYDFASMSNEERIECIRSAGIVGHGGATFPTHVKIQSGIGKCDTVIINAAECEPYITSDHRLLLERPEETIGGLKMLADIMGVQTAIIAIEENKKDTFAKIEELIADDSRLKLYPLTCKYPQGAEKMQIKAITNREVKPGGLPSGVGCNVISTQTAYAIYRACYEGMPSIERVLTVAGSAMGDKSYNLQCRFGTPFSYIVEQCGGFVVEPKKIVLGGPMMGLIATNLEAPNIKGTAGILFFTDKEDRSVENPTCIHCGKCLTVCPMKLEPLYMYKYYQKRDFENMQKYHILDCFECGSCSYNCPGRLPLTHTFKTAKLLFAARAAEEKARAEAAAKEAETK